jgi:hypothetical protein
MSIFCGLTHHIQLVIIAKTTKAVSDIQRLRIIESHPNCRSDSAQAKFPDKWNLESPASIPGNACASEADWPSQPPKVTEARLNTAK